MATPGSTAAPYLAYTTNLALADLDTWVPTFNVRGYGAKVDGVTNDTAAFASAVAAAAAVGGGIVQLAVGTMVADPPNPLPANVTIQGMGAGVSIVQAVTVNGTFAATDHSNITIRNLSFIGIANNGAVHTNPAVSILANTVDVYNIVVDGCAFHQTMTGSGVVNIVGNGADGVNAGFWVRQCRVTNCVVDTYYDQNPASLAVASYGIFVGYGASDTVVSRNTVDGTFGKHGIGTIGDNLRMTVTENHVSNCGFSAPNTYFGYGILCYSGVAQPCRDAVVNNNTILYTNRAGIYFQSVQGGTILGNSIINADQHSAGLGNIGVGAIEVNNSNNDTRQGPVTITGNNIVNPGVIAIYLNLATFELADCTVTGNACYTTTTGVDLLGVVLAGRGATITGNVFRGFSTGLFLYNTADNTVGDVEFSGNDVDMTGSTASAGVTIAATHRMTGVSICTNRFKGGTTGISINYAADAILSNNTFNGITGTNIVLTTIFGVVSGNISDGGTVGCALTCLTATAMARIIVASNVMTPATTPFTLTPNTGQILTGVNDSGTLSGTLSTAAQPNITSLAGLTTIGAALGMAGSPTNGIQTTFGSSTTISAVGTRYSGGDAYLVQNATQAIGSDLWTQSLTSAASKLLILRLNGAMEFYSAPSSTAAATFATFWGTPVFSVSAAGALVAAGGFGVNGATAQTPFASGGAAPAGGVGTAAGGWDTSAHRDAAITLINNMRTALINAGLMS
jgi:hypothetical protein